MMEVADYLKLLNLARDQLMSENIYVEIVGKRPANIGAFLFAKSPQGAVEVSIDDDQWFVEFWRGDSEVSESSNTLPSLEAALDATRDFLQASTE